MARKRFFVDAIRQSSVTLGGDEAKHLKQVLRAEPGQKYELCDRSRVVLAEVESFSKGSVTFRILDEIAQAPPLINLTLCVALIKLDRFEWVVEKATELGAARVIPVVTERSDYGLDKAVLGKLERWRRIALEAAKQSHRVAPPLVEGPASLSAVFASAGGIRLMLDENETKPLLGELPEEGERHQGDRIALLVGPEGGWTATERSQAEQAGFIQVSLGPVLLRAETAAVVGAGVLVAAWSASHRGQKYTSGLPA